MRVRETFPDTVLAADEMVLVDLTPEALIERLREGKIYPAERVGASLNDFFRIENLATLRELALREIAEEVEAKGRGPPRGSTRDPRVAERVGAREGRRTGSGPGGSAGELATTGAACVALGPAPRRRARPAVRRISRRAIGRRGARADRGAGPVGDRARGPAAGPGGQRASRSRRAVAAELGTTYVLIGQPPTRTGLGRLGESLPERLMRRLPGVDVRIVADRSQLSRDDL